jgi:hypothetical protein
MVAVGAEKGAGKKQSNELRFGCFFPLILFNSYVNHSMKILQVHTPGCGSCSYRQCRPHQS